MGSKANGPHFGGSNGGDDHDKGLFYKKYHARTFAQSPPSVEYPCNAFLDLQFLTMGPRKSQSKEVLTDAVEYPCNAFLDLQFLTVLGSENPRVRRFSQTLPPHPQLHPHVHIHTLTWICTLTWCICTGWFNAGAGYPGFLILLPPAVPLLQEWGPPSFVPVSAFSIPWNVQGEVPSELCHIIHHTPGCTNGSANKIVAHQTAVCHKGMACASACSAAGGSKLHACGRRACLKCPTKYICPIAKLCLVASSARQG